MVDNNRLPGDSLRRVSGMTATIETKAGYLSEIGKLDHPAGTNCQMAVLEHFVMGYMYRADLSHAELYWPNHLACFHGCF
jgi:hypothetical protein